MCDGNLAMANSLEYEDGFFENCPECGKFLYDIEFDMQYCEECGWGTNNAKNSCPQCGYEFDDADFDFQICHKCGWNGNK